MASEGTPFVDLGGSPRPQGRSTVLSDFVRGVNASGVTSGGPGNDEISGGAGDDTLFGRDGDDTLRGGSGHDEAHGGRGDDALFGNKGDDTLFGDSGDDTLRGGLGNDEAHGGGGADAISGNEGNDSLFGDGRNDTLRGGLGTDEIDGGGSSDRIFGDEASDTLSGGIGRDTIAGGTGDDWLSGDQQYATANYIEGGEDSLDGGDGNDTIAGDQSRAGGGTIHGHDDSIDGGAGNDSVAGDQFIAQTDGYRSCIVSTEDTISGDDGDDFIAGDQVYAATQAGYAYISGGNDVLGGDHGNDTIVGDQGTASTVGDGADIAGGDDTARGGYGDDFIVGDGFEASASYFNPDQMEDISTGDDLLKGDSGNDTIHGDWLSALGNVAGGDDTIAGGSGHDLLDGQFGNDTLVGGSGRDTLTGGEGSDTLRGGTRDDSLDGGSATDTAAFAGKIVDYEITTVGGVTTVIDLDTLAGGDDGTDTLTAVERLQFADAVVTVPGSIDLATLTADQGFVIYGVDQNDRSGRSVSSAGDINGDGFDDLIVGAPEGDAAGNAKFDAGESYVIFGTDAGFGASLDLAALTAAQGFVIYGADAFDRSGVSVSSAGDVNGDGFDDLILGTQGAGVDESYVIFGTDAGFGASLDLAALTAAQGFIVHGVDEYDGSGYSVRSAGDVNGDGFDDLIIGAPEADAAGDTKPYAGESYVIFGTDAGFGASLDLAALTAAQGFVIYGVDEYDSSGLSVSSAGDVNGDGFDDLVVGARGGDAAGNAKSEVGESYVIFGMAAGFGASLDLAALTAAQGFVIYGADVYDGSGRSVSAAGDINGDGFGDLIIGAPYADAAGNTTEAGDSYVIFGTATGFGASLDLAALTPAQGFVIYGADAYDRSGISVSAAGDVNGDGLDDLIIGAQLADAEGNEISQAGESYLIFGTAAGFGTSLDLAALTPDQGIVIYGVDVGDQSGSVGAAGDVNRDGFDDLIIGAQFADAAGNARSGAGESYVIYGGAFSNDVVSAGTAGDDALTHAAAGEALADSEGDGAIGMKGLDISPVDGGTGTETLYLDGAGLTVDYSRFANNHTRGIGHTDIAGRHNPAHSLSIDDLLSISNESSELFVAVDDKGVANAGSGWAPAASGGTNGDGTGTIGGRTYQIHAASQATLPPDADVSTVV